ncbi:GNAT family N-acetyltransferase [Nakamurella leprariae]|uniref:N-acetyltransferase n=1 Tax=Nakamurella leprariae TaxID=2803911 RepID=A0A938Y9D3_9ACTN|nr:GNAT family N-acetyltransferase [Nakamurella leprariae]MBM9468451.1 N-acetyltransferase [Nakamurella leprariae]
MPDAQPPAVPSSELPAPVVRPATVADAERLSEIHRPYVLETTITFDEQPWPPSHWAGRIEAITADGWPFLVVEDGPVGGVGGDRRVVGFAYVSAFRPKAAYRHTVEDTIYLDGASTGRGLGRLLLDALLEQAAAAGARQVIAVISDPGAESSIRLHRRAGFVDAGRLRAVGRKLGRWVDTVNLQRSLDGPAGSGSVAG